MAQKCFSFGDIKELGCLQICQLVNIVEKEVDKSIRKFLSEETGSQGF